MRVTFKITDQLLDSIRDDLKRPHRFAAERVGFISARSAMTKNIIVVAEGYHPVADDDYVDDMSVGAMMGQEAIRKALNVALLKPVGMFHVHIHSHHGRPGFSRTDLREQKKFVPDFFKVSNLVHGAIVLSYDRQTGSLWLKPTKVVPINEFNVVGPRFLADMAENRP